ncbi:MAG TPA: tetratricopeptide repeat protein [Spirochaetia bacterium]|nr:tetratricopeptide repeat protein [Spirochaetia bacterium]HRZ63856.1 tetratricopeptide repeat protein [Spirochaetia bacterium]
MSNAARAHKGQEQESLSLAQKIADFLRRNRKAFIAAAAAVLLAVAAVAIWSAIHSSAVKNSSSRLEKLEADIAALSSEQDAAKKAELEKAVAAGLDEVAATWPSYFAAQRAHAIKARLAADKEDWAAAEKEWLAAADARKATYLSPVALLGAAVAAEERGAPDKAAEHYQRLVDKHPASAGAAHAYFSLGRLAEEAKDYAAALGHYEKVVASFPDDDWTKLAKDRILSLKSRGLAK